VQHEIDAASVRGLTKADLTAFYNQYIDPKSETRAKVSIHLNSPVADVDKKLPIDTSETAEGADALHGQKTNGVNGSKHKQTAREPIYVTNVPQFKASLPVSAGPSPVVDLCEFEDFDPKL
jgi:insulysin